MTVLEQGGACARVHGPRFGLRCFGRLLLRLHRFGCSGRRSGSYVHMDRVGQHGEHGPADRYGHCFPTFYVPDEVTARRDVRIPLDRFGSECGSRHGGGNGDGARQGIVACRRCYVS